MSPHHRKQIKLSTSNHQYLKWQVIYLPPFPQNLTFAQERKLNNLVIHHWFTACTILLLVLWVLQLFCRVIYSFVLFSLTLKLTVLKFLHWSIKIQVLNSIKNSSWATDPNLYLFRGPDLLRFKFLFCFIDFWERSQFVIVIFHCNKSFFKKQDICVIVIKYINITNIRIVPHTILH